MQSVKKNYIFNLIYQAFLVIVPLVVTPYISRVLKPDGVGQYSYSYSIITYFTVVAALGFATYSQMHSYAPDSIKTIVNKLLRVFHHWQNCVL